MSGCNHKEMFNDVCEECGAKEYTELKAENDAWERYWRERAENAKLREAAQEVVEAMRGSGGINPNAAETLLKLAALLGGE